MDEITIIPAAPAPADPAPAPADKAPAPADKAPEGIPDPAKVAYEPTGNAALDVALDFLGSHGFAAEDAVMKAADTGDFAPLEKAIKDRAIPGGERYLELLKGEYAKLEAFEKAAAAERLAVVHKAAGGESQWEALRKWTAENATEAQRHQATEGLRMGGVVAEAVVEFLRARYERSGAANRAPRGTTAAPAAVQAPSNGALSPRDYVAAVESARKAHRGGGFEQSQEYQNLQARRRAYR